MPFVADDLPARNVLGHCPIDPLNETCEKFFQIWSHKAANISNDLIEYTIRRMQSDRLRFLFRTRNELTQQEKISPICQLSIHTEDDLQRIKEHIRRFCLSTRNVYRHLRSNSRIYPKMSIDLDQGIMIKICRFIFKTKVLIQIHSKEQHPNEQGKMSKIKQVDTNDAYRNVTKAFIVLQSNFEILFGDILDRDFFQNAKTAVQTLPIILDISKTVRLIFCALYKLSEPERQAEAEAIRQSRLAFCVGGYGSKKRGIQSPNISKRNKENENFKTINEMLKTNDQPVTYTSVATPTKTSLSPPKTVSNSKSTVQAKTKRIESPKRIQSSKSQLNSPKRTVSKSNQNRPLSSSSTLKRKNDSSKNSSTTEQKKTKSPNGKNKNEKKSKSRNKNAFTTDSTSSISHNQNSNLANTRTQFHCLDQTSNQDTFGWTTWLHNAMLSLPTISLSNQTNNNANSSKPLLTTWASLDRVAKI